MATPDPATTEWVPLWDTTGGVATVPDPLVVNDLVVNDTATLSSVYATDIECNDTLLVDGTSTLLGDVGLGGAPEAPYDLKVHGTSKFVGGGVFNSTLGVTGALSVGGDVGVAGVTYTKEVVADGSLSVSGDVGIGGAPVVGTDLKVYGTSSFNEAISAGADVVVTGTVTAGNLSTGGACYIAGAGTALHVDNGNVVVGGTIRELERATPLGHWITVPYSAANFTANTGTWTVEAGDQILFKYTLVGKTMTVALYISTSTLSAAPTELRIATPGGFDEFSNFRNTCQIYDATWQAGVIYCATGYLGVAKITMSAFTSAAPNIYVIGQISFEIV